MEAATSLAARIRREGDLASRSGQMMRLYELADVADTLRAQLEAAEKELRGYRLHVASFCKHVASVGCEYRQPYEGEEGDYLVNVRAEAAEANAARYEWLRDPQRLVEATSLSRKVVIHIGASAGPSWGLCGEHADKEIDAAMDRTKEETK